jgi:glycosyltransferase involved in cell wall biosynthesis
MRICYIAHGDHVHVDAYLNHFGERGHEVHLITLTPGRRRLYSTFNAGFKGQSKWIYLPAILKARKIVRSLAPNIVHAHYATSAGLAAYFIGIHPYVVTAHGSDVAVGVRSIIGRSGLRRIFGNAAWVNPVSDELREMILGLGIDPQKVDTLSFGIDTELFKFIARRFAAPMEPLRLVCTRRLGPVYQHATIIQSLAILTKREVNCALTLIGEGNLTEDLRKLAADLGVNDRITFSGALPNTMLPERLADHEVYLSASARDGTSVSLLEAFASGLYPIVSDIPANAAWIKHGGNGLLHEVGNPESLADCVLRFMRGREAACQAVRQNRETVEKQGNRRVNLAKLEGIYRRLCCGKRSALGLVQA